MLSRGYTKVKKKTQNNNDKTDKIPIYKRYPLLWEIFKFLLVGGIATVIDFLVMSVVLYVWAPGIYEHNFWKVFWGAAQKPSVAATVVGTGLGFLCGLAFNYIFSIIFVFSGEHNTTERAKTLRGFLLFTLLAVIGLGINTLGMYVGYDLLKINEWITKIILTLIVLLFNYVTRKYLLFKKKSPNLSNQA